MSFDLPSNVARDLEEYAQSEHISPAEAAVKLIQNGLKAKRRRTQNVAPLTEAELHQIDGFGKTFGLLADEPDDAIDRMAATIDLMKSERFPARA